MAAVGYPLWLWAGGRTHVGPVTDSAGGLHLTFAWLAPLQVVVTSIGHWRGEGLALIEAV